jgi:hypothetical protein
VCRRTRRLTKARVGHSLLWVSVPVKREDGFRVKARNDMKGRGRHVEAKALLAFVGRVPSRFDEKPDTRRSN